MVEQGRPLSIVTESLTVAKNWIETHDFAEAFNHRQYDTEN